MDGHDDNQEDEILEDIRMVSMMSLRIRIRE